MSIENKWFKTEEELINYIREQVNGPHSYDTSANAMANAAIATFNYVSSEVGASGFQAGWAGMQIIRQIQGLEGPFGIIDGTQFLFPQYNIEEKVKKWHEEWKPHLGKMAKEKLENAESYVHPDVISKWEEYAKYAKEDDNE
jgi:hypothetical protein